VAWLVDTWVSVANVTTENILCSSVLPTLLVCYAMFPVCGFIFLLIVRFKVLTAAIMKIVAFWDIPPCSLVEV
jgi:hypothetical protein